MNNQNTNTKLAEALRHAAAAAAENHRLRRVLRDVYDALAPCLYSEESILEPMPLSEFMDRNNAALEILHRAGLLIRDDDEPLRAAHQAVQAGFKLVPVKPTPEMMQAAVQAICYGPEGGFTRISGPSRCWAAMLAAAPAAPAPEAKPAALLDDWQHLKPYGYAPGNYMSRCHKCGATSVMDKRAVTCKPCAETLFSRAQEAGQELPPHPLPQAEFDALMDHIYEHGTMAEGITTRALKLCDAYARAAMKGTQ